MNNLDGGHFNNTYSCLPDYFYTKLDPTPLENPRLVAFSASAGQLLDLEDSWKTREELTLIGSGNRAWPGSEPLAMVYSGHQFGAYNPQLGDGRGLLLGELVNTRGEKWDLHLKGAGQTPYSRFGDGRAVLRSCIREYLASEALHHLGIPTTRALFVVTSDTPVYRETTEAGSTLLRLARSHIRFGHFEYFYYSAPSGKKRYKALKELADYTIEQHFHDLEGMAAIAGSDRGYQRFYSEVVRRTATLIAQWQAAGFAHGIMNTDNMSIIGDTFDYGPYGFMDDFNWYYICNHSDHSGRYAFSQQPDIGYWNCGRLGQALVPLFDDGELIQKALDQYPKIYTQTYTRLMLYKLGLAEEEQDDAELVRNLLQLLHDSRCDYTRFFRILSSFPSEQTSEQLAQLTSNSSLAPWLDIYQKRLKRNPLNDQTRQQQMKQVNPKYILRNYLAQQAIEKAEQDDYREIENLMNVLVSPCEEHPDFEHYAQKPPEWGKKLEVSCSS
ncbi:YdiU family protein [Endozoicomonas sp. SCSIO W0465]|uniref:protein adenylyltransferase SelO n=1 Tax=Endozoicomonas sp. SCSIO W0465 TaxID=2918516 RepID=UPI002075015A|nr:YdiU family protein [Endozoicomonas sp. SCSIO W0465]USE36056.1 YdiU family protein [Endozoicomonas sp. SCSIO W0465]